MRSSVANAANCSAVIGIRPRSRRRQHFTYLGEYSRQSRKPLLCNACELIRREPRLAPILHGNGAEKQFHRLALVLVPITRPVLGYFLPDC